MFSDQYVQVEEEERMHFHEEEEEKMHFQSVSQVSGTEVDVSL